MLKNPGHDNKWFKTYTTVAGKYTYEITLFRASASQLNLSHLFTVNFINDSILTLRRYRQTTTARCDAL